MRLMIRCRPCEVVGPRRLAGVHVLLDVEHLRAAVAVDHPHLGECNIVAEGAEAQGFVAALVRADVQDVAIGMAVDGLLAELDPFAGLCGKAERGGDDDTGEAGQERLADHVAPIGFRVNARYGADKSIRALKAL